MSSYNATIDNGSCLRLLLPAKVYMFSNRALATSEVFRITELLSYCISHRFQSRKSNPSAGFPSSYFVYNFISYYLLSFLCLFFAILPPKRVNICHICQNKWGKCSCWPQQLPGKWMIWFETTFTEYSLVCKLTANLIIGILETRFTLQNEKTKLICNKC